MVVIMRKPVKSFALIALLVVMISYALVLTGIVWFLWNTALGQLVPLTYVETGCLIALIKVIGLSPKTSLFSRFLKKDTARRDET